MPMRFMDPNISYDKRFVNEREEEREGGRERGKEILADTRKGRRVARAHFGEQQVCSID